MSVLPFPSPALPEPEVSPFDPGLEGLLARIGNTPLVRLRGLTRGLVSDRVEVWAKLEWFNPGGSVKDRAGLNMILQAERSGRLRPGRRLLDASSGNTGIAYAMIAAQRGYGLTLCMPANASEERKVTLRAYGAELVLTDPERGADGAIEEARALAGARPDRFVYLNQYDNDANWQAHFRSTGPEIWRDTAGRVTHWVTALGTSGTFTGTTRYLKSRNPAVQAISVQPDSATHGLDGMKHMPSAIVPGIYDPTLADGEIAVRTENALATTRRLAREEGLLVGISAGAAAWAAVEVARGLEEGVVVTLFADNGARYLSKPQVFGGA